MEKARENALYLLGFIDSASHNFSNCSMFWILKYKMVHFLNHNLLIKLIRILQTLQTCLLSAQRRTSKPRIKLGAFSSVRQVTAHLWHLCSFSLMLTYLRVYSMPCFMSIPCSIHQELGQSYFWRRERYMSRNVQKPKPMTCKPGNRKLFYHCLDCIFGLDSSETLSYYMNH